MTESRYPAMGILFFFFWQWNLRFGWNWSHRPVRAPITVAELHISCYLFYMVIWCHFSTIRIWFSFSSIQLTSFKGKCRLSSTVLLYLIYVYVYVHVSTYFYHIQFYYFKYSCESPCINVAWFDFSMTILFKSFVDENFFLKEYNKTHFVNRTFWKTLYFCCSH